MRFKPSFHLPIQPTQEGQSALSPYDFISTGIACNAFTLIERLGILDKLLIKGFFDTKTISHYENPPAIKAALLSLRVAHILTLDKSKYYLTDLGRELANHRGLITMLFEGYGSLMAKQVESAQGKLSNPYKYINGASVAISSIQFGQEKIDPLVINTIKSLHPRRTICDLGCGAADRLIKVCEATHLPGLGLDNHPGALKLSAKLAKTHPQISVDFGDTAHLKGVWEDVEILMQSFMVHDIVPDEECIRMLQSYATHFPNFKYLIIVDIVSPEDDSDSHMPGFDYVHGLQGVDTRKYQQTVSIFQKAGYHIEQELQTGMPNTYLWLLTPAHIRKR